MIHRVPLPRSEHDVAAALRNRNQIVLFGAGPFVAPVIHAMKIRGIIPCCVCDNAASPQVSAIAGVPVLSIAAARSAFSDALVVTTVTPSQIDQARQQLVEAGWWDVHDCATLLFDFTYDAHTFKEGIGRLHFNLDTYAYEYSLAMDPEV